MKGTGDYDTLVDALNAVADTVGKNRPTELALGLYWTALEPYEIDAILNGISLHMRNPDAGMFMPKPADIIRQIEGGGDERSLKAWTKLEQAIGRAGSWKPVAFDDARIHAVVADMGGWMRFCTATGDEWPFMCNEFQKRYRGFMQKPPTRYPALLVGEGNPDDYAPLLIGDQTEAKRVMLAGGPNHSGSVEVGVLMEAAVPRLQ